MWFGSSEGQTRCAITGSEVGAVWTEKGQCHVCVCVWGGFWGADNLGLALVLVICSCFVKSPTLSCIWHS